MVSLRLAIVGVLGVLVVGCHSDSPGIPNVTVTVHGEAGLAVGAPVWFYEADGTLDAMVKTDTAGQARAHIGPGASVTADLRGDESLLSPAFATLLGLQPDDDVQVECTPNVVTSSPRNQLTVTFAARPGVASYAAHCDCGPCGGQTVTASPATIFFGDACVGTQAQVVVVGQSLDYGVFGDYYSVSGDYTTPVTTTLAAGGTVDASTWTTAPTGTVSFQNIPESEFRFQRCSWAGCTTREGELARVPQPLTIPLLPFGPQTLDASIGFPAVTAHAPYDLNARTLHETVPAGRTDDVIDDTRLLPRLGASLDRGSRTVDLGNVDGSDYVDMTVFVDGDAVNGNWEIIGPPVGSLVLPPLPPGVGFTAPSLQFPAFVAQAIDPADATGWDAVRARAWSYACVLGDHRSSMVRAP